MAVRGFDNGTFFASILQSAFVAVCNSSACLGRMNCVERLLRHGCTKTVSDGFYGMVQAWTLWDIGSLDIKPSPSFSHCVRGV